MATRSGWEIEHKGIDWISDAERHGRPRSLFWPWTAPNISFFTVAYGVFVLSLGLSGWQAALAVVVGLALAYPLVGLVALAGTLGGAPTMTLSRAAFGYHGNKLPALFVWLSLVGWETISVALGALATQTILERVSPGLGNTTMLAVGFAITVLIVIVVGVYGYDLIMRVQKWISVVVGVMTLAYLVVIIPNLELGAGAASGGVAAMIGGITLVFANGVGWTPGGADYSRYLPRTSSPGAVIGWTAFGGACAPVVLMLFGILLSSGDPTLAAATLSNPIGAFATELPSWFLLPFQISVLLTVIGGAVFNLYSSGMNLMALGVRVGRPTAILIDGVLMVLGGVYLVFIAPSFFAPVQSFVITIGVVTAAWSAVFITDLLLHRRRHGYQASALYTPRGVYRGFNPAGVVSLVAAIVIGLGLVTSQDPNLQQILGYLLTDSAKAGSVGASNIGVAVAFVVAAALYALLSTTVARPATASAPASTATEDAPSDPTAPAGGPLRAE